MKLRDELEELEARRVAFLAMAMKAPADSVERGKWFELLNDVLAIQDAREAMFMEDPLGCNTWLLMESNPEVTRPLRKLAQ